MSKPKLSRSYLREGLLFLCVLLILVGFLASSSGGMTALSRRQRKSISKGIVLRNMESDPVKIKSMKVGSALRQFEEEFDETDDWLKKLSLEIKNDWNKPIIYLLVALSFPETDASGQRMTFHVHLGNRPGSSAQRESLSFSPGDKLVINIADRYEWLTQFIEPRQSMRQINKVEIQVTLAVSDDKTAWGEGVFFVQDPNKPSRYVPVVAKPSTQ